ncbi:MAG: alanine--tRNA ligase [Chitinophagales bacterium]
MSLQWPSKEIRKTFLDFFKDKQHQIVPSAPIVLKNDPTLMFTNAGMNQFKDYFLGNKTAKNKRITDTQKCLRVSGKHNDLEEVGYDTYHHTMFEMLGNWSFGDTNGGYFKKEAIAWAWELLVEVFKMDKDRMYVTIFEGDASDHLPEDKEAFQLWEQFLPKSQILKFGKKDNFWEMGASGPCGPCSEIHYDLRSDKERKAKPGSKLVNMDHPQVIEIWNLVFMQFNRKADESLEPLPAKHVDTGMGFERLCMVLQDKKSNYDTDVFMPIIREIEKISDFKYGQNEKTDVAIRVIADHLRAVVFAIADGQLPSNTGAGYVIRRILRRAIRYAYSYLNLERAFIYQLLPVLVQQMGEFFPELKKQKNFVEKVIKEEEAAFLKTLKSGLNKIEELSSKNKKGAIIDGAQVFELYDTYGFPADLTRLILSEKGMKIDEVGFEKELDAQRKRSQKDAKVERSDWTVLDKNASVNFIGYDQLEAEVKITRYRKLRQKDKDLYQLVFDQTPFYPEGGGQVGDRGLLLNENEKISIIDTQKENELIIHFSDKLPQNPKNAFTARVDLQKRKNAERNHSATHLLHAALKNNLGAHVEQKGSLVAPDYLRFDFSHFAKVTDEELQKIEAEVNEKIMENIALEEQRNIPYKKAIEAGATALFGEKYGDSVRMITFDSNYSRELCGGTHVQASGEIAYFKIVSESGVASGVRRIEALTGEKARNYVDKKLKVLEGLSEKIKNKDLLKGVDQLMAENQKLQKQVDDFAKAKTQDVKKQLLSQIKSENGINFIAAKVDLPSADAMKQLAFQLKKETASLFLVLGAEIDKKALLSIMLSDDLVKEKGLNAGQIIRDIAKAIKGGGGGQDFYATAGGKDPKGLDNAIELAKDIFNEVNNKS